jgi:hypothetical protein
MSISYSDERGFADTPIPAQRAGSAINVGVIENEAS